MQLPLHLIKCVSVIPYGGSLSLLTSTLDGGEWSASSPGPLFPFIICVLGCGSQRIDLVAERSLLSPFRESNHELLVVQTVELSTSTGLWPSKGWILSGSSCKISLLSWVRAGKQVVLLNGVEAWHLVVFVLRATLKGRFTVALKQVEGWRQWRLLKGKKIGLTLSLTQLWFWSRWGEIQGQNCPLRTALLKLWVGECFNRSRWRHRFMTRAFAKTGLNTFVYASSRPQGNRVNCVMFRDF